MLRAGQISGGRLHSTLKSTRVAQMHLITSRTAESRGYREAEKESVNVSSSLTIRKEILDMRATPADSTALFLLPFALFFVRVIGDGNSRTFTKLNGQKSQLISFDTKGGEVEVSISKREQFWNSVNSSGFSSTLESFLKKLTWSYLA